MRNVGFVETDDKGPELRQREPQRNLPAQHAALALSVVRYFRSFACSFSGHDEDEPRAGSLRLANEMHERGMCLTLRHAVQVDSRIDRLPPACDTLFLPLVERCERWRFFCGRYRRPKWLRHALRRRL